MNQTTIRYTLTQEAHDKEYIATGKRTATRERTLELDDAALAPEQRAILLEAHKAHLFTFSGLHLGTLTLKPLGIFDQIRIDCDPYLFNEAPSVDRIFAIIQIMLSDTARIEQRKPALEAEIARRKAEREAKQKTAREAWEAKRLADLEAFEQARVARSILTWDGDHFIGDLYEAIFATANLDRDHRFKSRIKEVTSVDKTRENGWCFVGDFLREGTLELTNRSTRRVYLVAATTGSRRFQTTEYAVVEMVDGLLYRTTIATNSSHPGWSLRIRDQVAALVGSK